MTLITDPDDLNQGTEIIFDTAARTVQLLQAGNLSTWLLYTSPSPRDRG